MPRFWIFMYRISPFTYLMSAIMATGVGDTTVQCAPVEMLRFNPPAGQTCGSYMAAFVGMAGGTVANPEAVLLCEYCPIATTNAFLNTVATSFDDRWRNLGIVWAYVAFNAGATLALYWLARVPKKRGVVKWLMGRGLRRVGNPKP